jgi:hypothetical protein
MLQHLKDILHGYNCMNQKCEHFKVIDEKIFLHIQKAAKNARKKNWVGLHYGCALYVGSLAVVILLSVFMQENILKIQGIQ